VCGGGSARAGTPLDSAETPPAVPSAPAQSAGPGCAIVLPRNEPLVGRITCGYLASSMPDHPLFASLPGLMVVPLRGRPGADWVESSFRHAARERAARRPGAQGIVAKLSELLLLEALREHIERLPPEATDWLAALRDPPLARALAAMHAWVAVPWTTEQLAEEALLSRSAFAERFVRTLGVPPGRYRCDGGGADVG